MPSFKPLLFLTIFFFPPQFIYIYIYFSFQIASAHPFDTDKLVPDTSKANPHLQFNNFSELINVIGIDFFNVILYNVSIGNQLVARGNEFAMIVSLLRLIQVSVFSFLFI